VTAKAGFQGVPSIGSRKRSSPHYPAVFQAGINSAARAINSGLVLDESANIMVVYLSTLDMCNSV
jgi:hypothetical protein